MLDIQNFVIKKETKSITAEELLDLGIVVVGRGADIEPAIKKLLGEDADFEENLGDLGLTMIKRGPLSDSGWILYKSGTDVEFVRDILQNRNFYTITLRKLDVVVEEFRHAYLRKDYIQEDIIYYIENRFNNLGRARYSVTLEGELH